MDMILASQSPRRRQLLEQMGLRDFIIRVSDADETVAEGTKPGDMVEELSLRKARAVAQQSAWDDMVIAADTVVALDGAVLGKPADKEDAFEMLAALSGKEHQVYTGVTVLWKNRVLVSHEVTAVRFRELEAREIWDYIATGEPMDKAGSYGIQGLGALLVEGITGDYFNVMGLPIFRLSRMLAQFGIDPLSLAAR